MSKLNINLEANRRLINSNFKITKINGVSTQNTNTIEEIPKGFIIKRINYLCEKIMVLINNDTKLRPVISKLIILSEIYKPNNFILRNKIRELIITLTESISISTYSLKAKEYYFTSLEKLCNIYNITDFIIISKIKTNLAKIKKQKINNTQKATSQEEDSTAENDLDINKLYFENIYRIILLMNSQIGDISDEEKIKWVYDYVFDMKYAEIPTDSINRNKDFTSYNPAAAAKKITKSGNVVPLNFVGKKFNGVYSKYNLIFAKEKSGLCGAKADLIVDILDFCLTNNNFCIDISGIHTHCTHAWNAIINANGAYHFDASKNWHDKAKQYLTHQNNLRELWRSYKVQEKETLHNTDYFLSQKDNTASTAEEQPNNKHR